MPNSLRIQKEMIALEAWAVADLHGLVKKAFPSIIDGLKDFFARTEPTEKTIVLNGDWRKFVQLLNGHRYIDLSPITCYTPEGMNDTYDAYSADLVPMVDRCEQTVNELLPQFCAFLASLISNKDAQLETISFRGEYKKLELERTKLNEAIATHFRKGRTDTVTIYGDVVRRNQDWEPVLQRAQLLSDRINKIDRKFIQKKIAECVDLMDTLEGKLKRNEFEKITPEIVDNLANGAYQVARELEFFSVTYYRVQAYNEALNRSTQYITDVLKK